MPKIRIREIDKTTNEKAFENEVGVFVVDSEAVGITEPTLVTDIKAVPLLTKTKSKAAVAETGSGYTMKPFMKEATSLGGKVYVCDTYEHAVAHLKSRDQFNIQFLLVDEKATQDAAEADDLTTKTDLECALEIAEARKDCVVVLGALGAKLTDETETKLKESISYSSDEFYRLEQTGRGGTKGKYVVALYGKDLKPWKANEGYVLAYLKSVAGGNPSWFAVAGKQRGGIPGMESAGYLTEDEIDTMQSRTQGISVNPICQMTPWGVRIWGNRTCVENTSDDLVAISFANIRLLICTLKKALYRAARRNQFEQNNDVLWINFKSQVNVLLEQMVQSYGIAGYKWIREDTNGERAKLKACLKIIPVEAVEDFDLTIELNDALEIAE